MKGYRTLLVNGAMLAALLADYVAANATLFGSLFSNPKHAALAIVLVNVANIVLRFVTTTAVGGKQ